MAIAARTARYIRPESTEISAYEVGNIQLAGAVTDELAKEGDLEKIEQYLLGQGYTPKVAADRAREATEFYSLGGDCLWITFADDHLWWTFAHPQVVWVSHDFVLTGERIRISISGWGKNDIRGRALKLDTLNARILRWARAGTSPDAETLQELLKVINGAQTQADRKATQPNQESSAVDAAEHQGGRTVVVPSMLFTVGAVTKKPSAAPDEAGIYAWWFDELPNVPLARAWEQGRFRLAYIGIASYRPGSRRTLRQRLHNHCKGPIATSTLRRSLAAILIDELDLHPFVVSGKVRLSDAEETRLSDWLREHGRVAWIADATPWVYETELLNSGPPLALNIRGNDHEFTAQLRKLRSESRKISV